MLEIGSEQDDKRSELLYQGLMSQSVQIECERAARAQTEEESAIITQS